MNTIDFNLLKRKLRHYPELIDKDEHFNSSVLIPFVKVGGEYHLLFEKRAAGRASRMSDNMPDYPLKFASFQHEAQPRRE